jgi:hypothetical protein
MAFNGMPPVDRIGPLSLRQTKALANIVAVRSGVWPPPPAGGRGPPGLPLPPPAAVAVAGGGGMANGGTGAGALPGQFYCPPFKYNQTVPVNLPISGDGYELRKR